MKTLLSLLFFIGIVYLFFYLLGDCSSDLISEIDKFQEAVGDTVVLQGDTLMIIDCSILNDSYTLEDGRTISYELVNKLERVGKK